MPMAGSGCSSIATRRSRSRFLAALSIRKKVGCSGCANCDCACGRADFLRVFVAVRRDKFLVYRAERVFFSICFVLFACGRKFLFVFLWMAIYSIRYLLFLRNKFVCFLFSGLFDLGHSAVSQSVSTASFACFCCGLFFAINLLQTKLNLQNIC